MSSAVKESYFWQQVKAGLTDDHTHLTRIENTAGSGISDISACRHGDEVWLELKIFHGDTLSFRTSQRVWIARRTSVGGRVLVIARKDEANGGASLYVYDARSVVLCEKRKVAKDGKSFYINVEDLPTPLFECQKPFKWDNLRQIIFGTTA